MIKRREIMPDGRRYIVYFTFDEAGKEERGTENKQTLLPSQEKVGAKGDVSQSPSCTEVGSDV